MLFWCNLHYFLWNPFFFLRINIRHSSYIWQYSVSMLNFVYHNQWKDVIRTKKILFAVKRIERAWVKNWLENNCIQFLLRFCFKKLQFFLFNPIFFFCKNDDWWEHLDLFHNYHVKLKAWRTSSFSVQHMRKTEKVFYKRIRHWYNFYFRVLSSLWCMKINLYQFSGILYI